MATAVPPRAAARKAALHYVSDGSTGCRRHRSGKGFFYTDPAGARIRDRHVLARIRALAIPPAWNEVWICPDAEGHLQATGRDARGRKQYRYHAEWRRVRDETKYGRMIAFGSAFPAIRHRVMRDLGARGIPRERVLATVVQLLERTLIRVGNDEYARTNHSFGLTTLQDRHVDVDGATMHFHFRGKSGKTHDVDLHDRRLARLVQQCRDLPGQDLFQYVDADGGVHPITSADVNAYLREATGDDFTAKDFRTWAGTLLAAQQLTVSRPDEDASSRSAVNAAITVVAAQLRNTPAVCRKCYIHPAILDAYTDQTQYRRWIRAVSTRKRIPGLDRDEAALLRFLRAAAR